jgi:hypothetical protein
MFIHFLNPHFTAAPCQKNLKIEDGFKQDTKSFTDR